ncbi:unnamed protein product [Caenorhabditis nigoni]
MHIYFKNHNELEEKILFLHVELLEHLVDGVAVSVVADGFVVALVARATSSSSLGDWSCDSKNEREGKGQEYS